MTDCRDETLYLHIVYSVNNILGHFVVMIIFSIVILVIYLIFALDIEIAHSVQMYNQNVLYLIKKPIRQV